MRPTIPMYFKFLDEDDRNLDMVRVARSSSSFEGKILVIVRRH